MAKRIRQIDEIPIASKAVRLRALDRMARRLEEMGNFLGAAQLLEQAAKELGGVYSGRGATTVGSNDQCDEPQDPGADHLAELGARYARGLRIVQGERDDPKDRSTPG